MDTPHVPVKSRSIRLSYPCAVAATVLIVGGAPPASPGLTGCAAPPPRTPVAEMSDAPALTSTPSVAPTPSTPPVLAAASASAAPDAAQVPAVAEPPPP